MATIQRQSILRGPGLITRNSVDWYCKDPFEVIAELKVVPIVNTIHGEVDNRVDDAIIRAPFTPAGEVENLSALYPHQNPVVGASLFGSTDVATDFHSVAGTKVTVHNTQITKMPDLILSANKTVFGQGEIMGLLKNNTARATANSMYTMASVAFSNTSFSTAAVKTEIFSAAWGSILTAIIAEQGWRLSFDLDIEPVIVDDLGTVDYTLRGVRATARCRPVNLTEANIWDSIRIQSTGATRGTSVRQGANLVIQSSSLTATLHDAALLVGPLNYGPVELRGGEIAFTAHRAESAGTFSNVFTLA